MRMVRPIAAMAALCLLAFAAEKQLRPGESELYNEVLKDLGSPGGGPKAVTDLDTWQQRVPDSDYRDERTALFVQAYALSNQPAKALDAAGDLISRDPGAVFPGPEGQAVTIRLLYNAVWAISQLPKPTANEITTGSSAAHQLIAYDRPLPGVAADKWAEARKDMTEKASAALLYIAILPGVQAMAKQPPDCKAAENAYSRALAEYPDKAAISYELGRALNCEARTMPDKEPAAIYEFLRATTIDPTLGDARNDKKKIQAFADNGYIEFHGSDEGLEQLRQQVRQGPLPPAGFRIATAGEVEDARRAEYEKNHPQAALWMKIEAVLSGDEGAQYFESQMKDTAVPRLRGVLVEAKPACHARELLVAMPTPDTPRPPRPEIRLKLDKPLAGKVEENAEFEWEGVPTAFTKEPFLLTMDAETAKIEGLKTTPCAAAAPGRKAPGRHP